MTKETKNTKHSARKKAKTYSPNVYIPIEISQVLGYMLDDRSLCNFSTTQKEHYEINQREKEVRKRVRPEPIKNLREIFLEIADRKGGIVTFGKGLNLDGEFTLISLFKNRWKQLEMVVRRDVIMEDDQYKQLLIAKGFSGMERQKFEVFASTRLGRKYNWTLNGRPVFFAIQEWQTNGIEFERNEQWWVVDDSASARNLVNGSPTGNGSYT